MLISREVFLLIGIGVLTASVVALILQSAVLALVIDDWYELRQETSATPEKLVATDELWSGIGLVIAVLLTVAVGITWVILGASMTIAVLPLSPVTIVIATVTIGHALLANIQGFRSLFYRRKMARMISGSRRPTALRHSDDQ